MANAALRPVVVNIVSPPAEQAVSTLPVTENDMLHGYHSKTRKKLKEQTEYPTLYNVQ